MGEWIQHFISMGLSPDHRKSIHKSLNIPWSMKRAKLSIRYTTNWNELPVVLGGIQVGFSLSLHQLFRAFGCLMPRIQKLQSKNTVIQIVVTKHIGAEARTYRE